MTEMIRGWKKLSGFARVTVLFALAGVACLLLAGVAILAVGSGGGNSPQSTPAVFAVPLTADSDVANAPDWYVGTLQSGGAFLEEPPGWYVPAGTPQGEGSLYVVIERSALPATVNGNSESGQPYLLMTLTYLDAAGAALYVDLLDTNLVGVVSNVCGNLIEGENEYVTVGVPLLLAATPEASAIRIRREQGETLVTAVTLGIGVVTSGGASTHGGTGHGTADARTSAQGAIQGTDTTPAQGAGGAGDGTNARSGAGVDAGGSTNPPSDVASASGGRVVFVSQRDGDDTHIGRSPVVVSLSGNRRDGPKRTIGAGLFTAEHGDRIVVREGRYGENLNIAGRDISVRIEGCVDLTGPPPAPAGSPAPPPPAVTNGVVGGRL